MTFEFNSTKYTPEYVALVLEKATLILNNFENYKDSEEYVLVPLVEYSLVLSTLGIALGNSKDKPEDYVKTFVAIEAFIEALEESLEASANQKLH